MDSKEEHQDPCLRTEGLEIQLSPHRLLKKECLQKSFTAFATKLNCKKITQKVFMRLFGFSRLETAEKLNANTSNFHETFFKNMEQRVLRKFLGLSQLHINKIRKIKKDRMSLSIFKKELVSMIEDDEIKKLKAKLQDMEDFLDPYFNENFSSNEFSNKNNLKNRVIVECFIFWKIRHLILDQSDKRILERQQKKEAEILQPQSCQQGINYFQFQVVEQFWQPQLQSNSLNFEKSPREQEQRMRVQEMQLESPLRINMDLNSENFFN